MQTTASHYWSHHTILHQTTLHPLHTTLHLLKSHFTITHSPESSGQLLKTHAMVTFMFPPQMDHFFCIYDSKHTQIFFFPLDYSVTVFIFVGTIFFLFFCFQQFTKELPQQFFFGSCWVGDGVEIMPFTLACLAQTEANDTTKLKESKILNFFVIKIIVVNNLLVNKHKNNKKKN